MPRSRRPRVSQCGLPPIYTTPTTEQATELALAYTLGAPFEVPGSGTYRLAEVAPAETIAALLWLPVSGSVMVWGKSAPRSMQLRQYGPRVIAATGADRLEVSCAIKPRPELPGMVWPLLPRTR